MVALKKRAEEKGVRTNYRWIVAGLIFIITLINFIDRSAIAFVVGPLKQEFHFTDTEFGLISAAFSVGYILLTAFGGRLVDLLGARFMWPVAAVAWSICVGLLGVAGGFWSFVGIRFLLGVTEGPHFPAVTRSVSNWLSPSERARALSLCLMGIPLSYVIGAPITSYLVADFGWRTMFFIISSIGIIWAFVWAYLFHDNPKDSPYVNDAEREYISPPIQEQSTQQKDPTPWRFILTNPTMIANNIAYFAFGYMLFFATLWLPGYFLSQYNLNLKAVGWYLTIPWLTGAIFLKAGGIISDHLYKTTGRNRLAHSHLIWGSQLCAAICFLILGFTDSLGMAIVFLSLGLGFGFMPQPSFFSVNILVAKERAGSAQGVTSGCLALAGIIAPCITGYLSDLTGNFQAAFLLLAGLTGIAVFTVIFFHDPDKEWAPRPRRQAMDCKN
jgi:MFS family permease